MGENTTSMNQLQRKMKSRHLFMISLGGVIGTGLFLNSGYTIMQQVLGEHSLLI